VREGSRANLASKLTLDTTELVLEVLSLLAEVAFSRVGTDRLDGVSDALYVTLHSLRDDRKVFGKRAIIIDQEDIFKVFGCIAPDELSDDFRSDGRPNVVDTVRATDLFGIVERCRAVSVGDYEDV
jgi:hypothetical protein